jgi:hypothetical protein
MDQILIGVLPAPGNAHGDTRNSTFKKRPLDCHQCERYYSTVWPEFNIVEGLRNFNLRAAA